jgi:hypothetical protein
MAPVTPRTLTAAFWLAVISAVISAVVAINEFDYTSGHPHAYGPALNIAWGAVALALLSVAVALVVNGLRHESQRAEEARPHPRAGGSANDKRGFRRYLTPKTIAVAVAVAVVLVALSPAVQGYHLGRSISDTACITRLAVQFCKDDHARMAREEAAAAKKECKAIAREAENGKRRLGEGNYYLKCLRPGAEARLLPKWRAEEAHEHAQEEAQKRHEHEQEEGQNRRHREQLEGEGNALKAKAKSLTEEHERLSHENKFSQSFEKSEEADKAKEAGDQKLKEAQEVG